MTCVIGLIDEGRIYIGADSAATSDSNHTSRKDTKVFVNDDFIMGFTTSYRMGQILQYSFVPPKYEEGTDLHRYMCVDFIDQAQLVLKEKGFAEVQNNQVTGGNFLVGYKGTLFEIYDDFQVGINFKNYCAVGCGFSYALGSMYATEGADFGPTKRILMALEAAEEFSSGVRRPFIVKNI